MNPCLVYLHIETSIQIYFTKAMVNCLYIFVYQPGCKLNRVSLYDGLFSRELFGLATASDHFLLKNRCTLRKKLHKIFINRWFCSRHQDSLSLPASTVLSRQDASVV